MTSQAGDGTLSAVEGRPVMVSQADSVRGGCPLAGARAARAVYTLERMATGSVPQRLCADDRAVCEITDRDGHSHTGGYYAYQHQTDHAAIAEVPQGHFRNRPGCYLLWSGQETAAQREQLKYLARCALPADITLYADQEGTRFTFPGGLGLAPRWVDEAMTPSEERWGSACLLAHVNYFGKHVLVSMRATPPPVPALAVAADEQQTFTLFEGGFFGNLFTPEPVAYACQGA